MTQQPPAVAWPRLVAVIAMLLVPSGILRAQRDDGLFVVNSAESNLTLTANRSAVPCAAAFRELAESVGWSLTFQTESVEERSLIHI